LGLAASIVLFVMLHRLVAWPPAAREDLSRIPASTLLPSLLMTAIVAGISEEAGFRGYMQAPLERRYGAAAAIAFTSAVFGLSHLTHGTFAPAILFDTGWGVLYGMLAYWSGSIVPGIILHSAGDALGLVAAWQLAARTPAPLTSVRGVDAALWWQAIACLALGTVAFWAFGRLRLLHARATATVN
jgi:membrane protease YdiL (CAAX protease family)